MSPYSSLTAAGCPLLSSPLPPHRQPDSLCNYYSDWVFPLQTDWAASSLILGSWPQSLLSAPSAQRTLPNTYTTARSCPAYPPMLSLLIPLLGNHFLALLNYPLPGHSREPGQQSTWLFVSCQGTDGLGRQHRHSKTVSKGFLNPPDPGQGVG